MEKVLAMEQSPNMIAGKDFTAEPVFPNSDFSLRSIDLSTGVSMEYVECGETNNDVIIFLHGWLDSWYSWSQVVGQFTDRYHVFVPSLRGHGLSSKPDTSYSMKEHALDLRAFMDQLGIASSSFVGHRLGASNSSRFTQFGPPLPMTRRLYQSVLGAQHEAMPTSIRKKSVLRPSISIH